MARTKLPRDSVLVYIPLSVTADLGVAMRRVRLKRIAQLKSLHPSIFERKHESGGRVKGAVEESGGEQSGGDESGNEEPSTQKTKLQDFVPQRDQFGSVVDYLEAKYVKGVMIDDLDEKIRERQKKQKKDESGNEDLKETVTTNNEKDMSILSDSQAGSCYSDSSGGFIDDSELQSDVAQQLRASSVYGTTKIEAEAVESRKDKSGSIDDAESGDHDDAFFVNIGDLEMEDGYIDDEFDDFEGWMDSTGKGKRKKRKRAPRENTSSNKDSNKPRLVSKKSKDVSERAQKQSKAESMKNKNSKAINKTSKTTKTEKSKKEKKLEEEEKNHNDTSESDIESKGNEILREKEIKDKETKETLQMTLMHVAKKEASELKKKSNKLYKKCVAEVKKLTEEHIPRKPRSAGKVKVSITVPDNKKGGDTITFSNPHLPTQKLKVQIPENSKRGDSFKVSVPMPKVAKSLANAQNKFSKDLTNTLDEYSKVYDDWCQAEAKSRALQPKKKGTKSEQFKAGVERLKKYDEMLAEFPKNLLHPIDAIFIRKVVRRNRQNANKRLKALAANGATTSAATSAVTGEKSESTKKKQPTKMIELTVPGKGVNFPSFYFVKDDFERKDI